MYTNSLTYQVVKIHKYQVARQARHVRTTCSVVVKSEESITNQAYMLAAGKLQPIHDDLEQSFWPHFLIGDPPCHFSARLLEAWWD